MSTRTTHVTLGIVAANLLLAGVAYFIYLQRTHADTGSADTTFGDVPDYRIVERRLTDDRAIISLAMSRPSPENAKKVARNIVEKGLANNQRQARFFVYREGKNMRKDDPDHELNWAIRQGITLDY